ncbi:phosphate regulon transcriptional regulator PhoB [Alphaproteobacteria bacterium]|jgi:two-component system, OmpR family, phosphate regulon response regulator PhoB|nr:phosphate regulon transcriptional regulator PhoB [Alphaproteobacteria bacterium]MBT5799307.1 phosphate regulon transcriptional regulator PhoB [Alphaproteobacteria bacterium]MDA9189883.1 phosphate regulon transcriptional regulator PhoB [Alphaproteobacteria bacterium]MDC0462350.1 phosphate regulon transcriptional regulator PhoB [Alphaproteobacteria bacterium]
MTSINVLIADDEPNQLELVRFNLEQADFSVITAEDGEQAVILAQELTPDIILLDWMMPNMSGIDVCRKLRSKSSTREIPIIMLSARGEEGDRILGLDVGADDYISKPFSPVELIARIKAVLRRTRPSLANAVIEYGNLRLYPAQKLVERDGRQIHLGPKEFQILSLLIERPGQVFSRAQLLDNVWGHGVYIEDRTVDVHIGRLRKALQESLDGKNLPDLIRTVRNSGYALHLPSVR